MASLLLDEIVLVCAKNHPVFFVKNKSGRYLDLCYLQRIILTYKFILQHFAHFCLSQAFFSAVQIFYSSQYLSFESISKQNKKKRNKLSLNHIHNFLTQKGEVDFYPFFVPELRGSMLLLSKPCEDIQNLYIT